MRTSTGAAIRVVRLLEGRAPRRAVAVAAGGGARAERGVERGRRARSIASLIASSRLTHRSLASTTPPSADAAAAAAAAAIARIGEGGGLDAPRLISSRSPSAAAAAAPDAATLSRTRRSQPCRNTVPA